MGFGPRCGMDYVVGGNLQGGVEFDRMVERFFFFFFKSIRSGSKPMARGGREVEMGSFRQASLSSFSTFLVCCARFLSS